MEYGRSYEGEDVTKEKRSERAHKESGQKGKKQRDIDKNTEIRGN
jgi:hypothetical protein